MAKKGKKKKKGEKKITGPPAPHEITENNKEFYIVQIKDLEQKIFAYQKKCDELEIRNAEFQVKLDRIVDDQNDIVSFIEKKLEKKREEVIELGENFNFLQAAKLQEQQLFEEQFAALIDEYNEVKENLTKENELLAKRIQDLDEFKGNKNNMFMVIKQLETELFDQEAEHRDARYILDKQHLVEKDKLKQEMIQQVKLVANEFKRVTRLQMSETTKRTIRENVVIHNQLIKMSEKTTELIEENDTLKVKISKQMREINVLEENAKKLIKKNVCNHQTLTLLKTKCQTLGETLTRGVIETKDRLEELITESKTLNYELKQARNLLKELHAKNKLFEKEKERLQEEVEEKEMLKRELEKLISSSAVAIEKLIEPGPVENCDDMANMPALKREHFLEVLLVLLNSSQCLDPQLLMDPLLTPSYLSMSVENQRIMQNVPQYKPGYLGLIPHANIFPKVTETRPHSSWKRRGRGCNLQEQSIAIKPPEFDEKLTNLAEELLYKGPPKPPPKTPCKLPHIVSGSFTGIC